MLNIHESLIPEKIRSIRNRLGLTQRELAEKLRVDPVTISRWENGKGTPRRVYQEDLIELYNDFIGGEQTELKL